MVLGDLGEPWRRACLPIRRFKVDLGGIFGGFWWILERSWGDLGGILVDLGEILGVFGGSWADLGAILGDFGGILGAREILKGLGRGGGKRK